MNILFMADVPRSPDSGAAGTEYQTIQALRRRGHTVDEVWAPELGRRIRHGNLHYLVELPWAYRRTLRERCARRSYDVVHVNQSHGCLAARDHANSRRRGVFVYRSHGLDDRFTEHVQLWSRRLGLPVRPVHKRVVGFLIDRGIRRHEKLAARYAAGIIVSSSGDRAHLLERWACQAERVAVIPQAAPDLFLHSAAAPWTAARGEKLLHVSGFAFWKAPQVVAGAANQLLAAHPSMSLTWVCHEQDFGRVEALLAPTVKGQVTLLPWLPQDRLIHVYDDHGIFLYPSFFDGFGKVFLEAMSRGLCVVSTPIGGMEDIIRTNENGVLVPMNDVDGLCAAVRHLRGDAGRAASMSRSARATAEGYTWDRVGRETESFYEHLMNLGRGGTR